MLYIRYCMNTVPQTADWQRRAEGVAASMGLIRMSCSTPPRLLPR